jgi:hypothetical protein
MHIKVLVDFPSKIVEFKSSCVGRGQLELSLLASSISSSQAVSQAVEEQGKKRHQHLGPATEDTIFSLPTSKCIAHSVTFLLCSPHAHGVQPRDDIVLLTCWLFLLCWLHLNCCGHWLNIIEASLNKLMVVPRRRHRTERGRMQKTLCVQGTAF